jgi:hypothetical protein
MASGVGLREIIERLAAESAAVRDCAALQLRAMSRLGLGSSDALAALQAAAGQFPAAVDGLPVAVLLIRAAARVPRKLFVPVVEEHFARYSGRARVEALRLLAHLGDRKAADTYMALVRRHAPQGALPGLAADAVLDKPVNLDRYFPELLAFVAQPQLAAEICRLALALCDEELLDPRSLCPRVEALLAAYRERRERLLVAELEVRSAAAPGADLSALSGEAALMLELLGRIATPEAELELQLALDCIDFRLRSAAARALVRLGRHVEPSLLADATRPASRVAALPERAEPPAVVGLAVSSLALR